MSTFSNKVKISMCEERFAFVRTVCFHFRSFQDPMVQAYLQGHQLPFEQAIHQPSIIASTNFKIPKFQIHKSLEVPSIPAPASCSSEVSYLARFGLVENERRAGLFWIVSVYTGLVVVGSKNHSIQIQQYYPIMKPFRPMRFNDIARSKNQHFAHPRYFSIETPWCWNPIFQLRSGG